MARIYRAVLQVVNGFDFACEADDFQPALTFILRLKYPGANVSGRDLVAVQHRTLWLGVHQN